MNPLEKVFSLGNMCHTDASNSGEKWRMVLFQVGSNIKIKVSEGLADVARKYFDVEVIANVSRDESRAYLLLPVDLKDDGVQIF